MSFQNFFYAPDPKFSAGHLGCLHIVFCPKPVSPLKMNHDITVPVHVCFGCWGKLKIFRRVQAVIFGSDAKIRFCSFESNERLPEHIGIRKRLVPHADVGSEIHWLMGNADNRQARACVYQVFNDPRRKARMFAIGSIVNNSSFIIHSFSIHNLLSSGHVGTGQNFSTSHENGWIMFGSSLRNQWRVDHV
ncbi:MAG: hypothetical protein UY16_C0013G0017 [Candidatus Gottesmanbacteria bacterium GW2011_GWA2_47_9]|uniref:Uncharacterized protein n=1 Tax=Candidatus Gottesmanbacteria bacterium GW2011_GWA2_47_9 TaxID=1618445 RepID=A0A0G1U1Z5_9BACT|nr:MAG: hypothetical protein UY16_C0013G0017 [Candidatus Gottesmanbacteria bacterium GW2011_GWA2_47_9]